MVLVEVVGQRTEGMLLWSMAECSHGIHGSLDTVTRDERVVRDVVVNGERTKMERLLALFQTGSWVQTEHLPESRIALILGRWRDADL